MSMSQQGATSSPPLTGGAQIVGLIGWPVAHSKSPAMHNAAFAALGLDWCYVPLPVDTGRTLESPAGGNEAAPDWIAQAVYGLRALGLRGANVTVPHKQAVIPHLDRLTAAARAIGAVNTIMVDEQGALVGDNTDAPGLIADLRDHHVDLAGRSALVLGAGGSARAAVYGLADAGCSHITVANRTLSRAQELAGAFAGEFAAATFAACSLALDAVPQTATGSSGAEEATLQAAAEQADLIVNCTSLGMSPNIESTPWPETAGFRSHQTVYDLVYNPRATRLLQQAAADGARAIGGIGMLVWQGAIAFQRWTGLEPPVDVMRTAGGLR